MSADEYRDSIQEELYFAVVVGMSPDFISVEDYVSLMSEEYERIMKGPL